MPLSTEDRCRLIQLARQTIAHEVAEAPAPQPGPILGVLAEKRGCFVTLTNQGMLRGCIGTFSPRRPLAQSVVEMACEACHDPRFVHHPVTARELGSLTVEVSVLGPLEPIADPLSLELGKHGIYIINGYSAGCFLPEVAIETGWTAEEFLTHCCQGKAGMSGDAWKRPDTQVYVFTSEKFKE